MYEIYQVFISPALMGFLFLAFALAMAVATFLENDFGSPAAYSMVYGHQMVRTDTVVPFRKSDRTIDFI